MKKLLSLILAVAMTLALFTGVTASALTVTNQIFVNGEEGALASGNIDVTVQHDELATAATVFGAIYENDRLFAIKSNVAGTNSTDLAFGDLTLDSAKTYTFKSFILADAETLAIAEAKGSAAVETIYVQAEEFDTYTTKAGTVITAADVAGGMIAGGMAVGDCMYKPNGEAFPSENSGAGIPLNEWSMVYGVTWRGNAGQELATYTANVPAAGTYKVTLSAISWGNRDLNVTVGETTKNVATTYATDTATLVPMEIGEFDFVAGENTITFAVGTIGAYDIQVDYIAVEPASVGPVVPTEEPTEAPALGETVYVQGEEFDTLTTKTGAVYTGEQVATGWLASGASIDYAVYVANDAAFPSENSGAGIPLNEWSKVYAVNLRGDAGQELATYTANVPEAGTYKVTLSAISWGNRDMNVTVGETTKNVATTYATDTSAWVPMELGEFDFVAGDNTITLAVGTIGSYDIQVDYIAIEPATGSTEPTTAPTAEPTEPTVPTEVPTTAPTTAPTEKVIPTPDAEGNIKIEAEEFFAYYEEDGRVLTSMLIADGFDASVANYRDTMDTGVGVVVNEYDTTQSVVWKWTGIGTPVAMYKAEVPAAGEYTVSITTKNGNERDMYVGVQDRTYTGGHVVYTEGADANDTAYVTTTLTNVVLNAGVNEITISFGNGGSGTIYADYITLTYVGTADEPTPVPTAAPTEVPTEAPTAEPLPEGAILVQAEEFDTYVSTTGTVLTGVTNADGMNAGDAMMVKNGNAFPSAYSGNGIAYNEWDTVYGVVMRARSTEAAMATYTVNAAAAGRYEMIVYGYSASRTFVAKIGENQYSKDLTYSDSFSAISFGNVQLAEGANTLEFYETSHGNGNFSVDYIMFKPVSDNDAIRVEAEEFDSIDVTKDGITTSYTSVWNGLVTGAGHVLNEGGLPIAEANNGTGAGVAFNQYAKSYCVIFRSGVSYKYTVEAPVAGDYTLKLRTDCCNENAVYPIVWVNDAMTDIYAPLDIAPDYSTYFETELGTVALNEGTNTITFEIAALDYLPDTEASDGYFDWFEVQLVPAA